MTKEYPVPPEKRTQDYWKKLNTVIDPEVGIGVVDLGLIYDVDINKQGEAHIKMTLTSPACPVGPVLVQQVEDTMLTQVKGVTKASVEITWEPTWNQEFIDEDIREMMFGY